VIAHEHSHLTFPARARESRVALRRAILLTGLFMLVEAAAGVFAHSLALLADAGHMFTDVTALVVSLLAVYLVTVPANLRLTFGYYRMEVLAALANGILLLGITAWIVIEAVERLTRPAPVRPVPMLLVAVAGLAVNLIAVQLLRATRGGLNVRSAMLHVLSDAAGSVATIAAAVVILLTGWTRADPVISLVIAALIVTGAVRIVIEAVQVLMEGTPEHLDLARVQAAIRAVPGVRGVHDLHAWTVTSSLYALSAHVVVDDPQHGQEMLAQVKEVLLEQFDLAHTTLQIEGERFAEVKAHV
jgi:cobalt-zinc-cadmium efflux system protein